ncbi:MAG: radical SAM protein [Firmicutes bacterium]|jgi:putative pyruvate formate lyase activating enzyme|nr:radical SAM protein [Bacillota bacterium]
MPIKPSYLKLAAEDLLVQRAAGFTEQINNCMLCPHNCRVDRREVLGFCQGEDVAIVSNYGPHYGEESVLVGHRGSGTIFFGNCNMACVYCQNYQLSFYGDGVYTSNTHLADIMLILQNSYKCHNVNLVSPTHYLGNIVPAIHLAVQKGLTLPFVYNSGGYENLEVLKELEGIIDIYMPDFKYFNNETAFKYSGIKNYADTVKKALIEMDRQVGGLKTQNGIAYRGLLIRHLLLPDQWEETKEILKFIKEELSPDVLLNLMGQYYPAHLAYNYEELSKPISRTYFNQARTYALELGLRLQ